MDLGVFSLVALMVCILFGVATISDFARRPRGGLGIHVTLVGSGAVRLVLGRASWLHWLEVMMSQGPWSPMRSAMSGGSPSLPGKRGRYLLYLGTGVIDPIDGRGRFCHFSWNNDSFALRDYITGRERRQGSDLTVERVWRAAQVRIPATGKYFVPVEDGQFWLETLGRLTAEHHDNSL